jgi:hypothetical protein
MIDEKTGFFTMSPTDIKAYEKSGIVDVDKL